MDAIEDHMFIVKINMQLEYVFLGTSEHHVEHHKTQSRPLDFISLYYSTVMETFVFTSMQMICT